MINRITSTYSPTDSRFCFSSFFNRGRPGFIFKGEVGVFWAAGWMKWANNSVCFNRYSNLFDRSVCCNKRADNKQTHHNGQYAYCKLSFLLSDLEFLRCSSGTSTRRKGFWRQTRLERRHLPFSSASLCWMKPQILLSQGLYQQIRGLNQRSNPDREYLIIYLYLITNM